MLKLPLAVLTYGIVFHYAYVVYINPVFEYAHYVYFPPPLISLLFTYSFVVAPVIGYRPAFTPASYGAALVFALCYVPAQLILLFTWKNTVGELICVQISVALSMMVLLRTSAYGAKTVTRAVSSNHRMSLTIAILTSASLLILIVNYHQYMRFVSFEDVYDLRSESTQIDRGVVINYLTTWLSYCFLPFYFARGILLKNSIDIGIGVLGSLLIYTAMGSKSAILMGGMIYVLYLLFGSGRNFLLRLVLTLAIFIFLVITLLPDDGASLWIKSLLLVRVLGTTGWTMSVYYDYFSNHGFTFYTHIGPINALTHAYTYGQYSLGQLIGIEYSGSPEANFNANFWASDAFAALGIAGVPIVTVALSFVFFLINYTSRNTSTKFVFLWLSGFWLALLNLPLSVALLSGGGLMTMFLLWLASVKIIEHRALSNAIN